MFGDPLRAGGWGGVGVGGTGWGVVAAVMAVASANPTAASCKRRIIWCFGRRRHRGSWCFGRRRHRGRSSVKTITPRRSSFATVLDLSGR